MELNGAYPREDHLLWELLPGLGQQPLYDSIQSIFKSPTLENLKKLKTLTFAVSELVCPDETANMDRGNSNYYGNEGTQFHDNSPTNGLFRQHLLTRPADVTDGLSNTAAMSERLVGTYESRVTPEKGRSFWFTGTRYARPGDELLAVQECRANRTTFDPQFYSTGASSYRSNGSGYNHLLLPNEWACYNGPEDFQSTSLYYLIPPSSLHDRGVNVLLMDGSVRFIHDGIDEAIWRAIGTIAGAETVSIHF